MPLSSGRMAVFGPTAGANDLIASCRSNALQLSSTRSKVLSSVSACTVGGTVSVTSPLGLLMTRPADASSAARRGRTRNVTSRPACSILPPKYPPIAPAPTTRIRMMLYLLFVKRYFVGVIASAMTPDASICLPLFAERAYFQFESPGAARLLVKLPIGSRDGSRRHQQIRIVERFLAPELFAPLAHPGGIDARVDDQVSHVDVLGAEFARHRLRHGPKSELRAGKRRKAAAAA